MTTTNAAQTLMTQLTCHVTEVIKENGELKERVNELEEREKELEAELERINDYKCAYKIELDYLLRSLTDAETRAEIADARLGKIEKLSVEGHIRIANALRNIKYDSYFDSRRCQSETKHLLDLICGIENVSHYTEKVHQEKIQTRKESFKKTKESISKKYKEDSLARRKDSRQRAINVRRLSSD
jgi:hypothetical protein